MSRRISRNSMIPAALAALLLVGSGATPARAGLVGDFLGEMMHHRNDREVRARSVPSATPVHRSFLGLFELIRRTRDLERAAADRRSGADRRLEAGSARSGELRGRANERDRRAMWITGD